MALKPVKYIQIDDQKGTLYSAGKRSLLVPVAFVKVLNSTFIQLIGREGAEILVYKIGQALGRGYAQDLKVILKEEKTEVAKETMIRVSCSAIFMEAGWGRVKIRKVDLAEKLLEVEITYSPSGEFLEKKSCCRYGLEEGVIAGIYQEITKEEVYCQLLKEDRKKHTIILRTLKEIPEEIRKREKIILFTRKKLEQMIKNKTKELQEKIDELERFHKLTVDRELRMIELKERIKEMKKSLSKPTGAEEISKEVSLEEIKNCWDFWKCSEEITKDCPAYKTDSGRECWLIAPGYCPHIKRKFKTCTECPWFKKLNKSSINKT